MAVAKKTMSTRVGGPWCWWYISTVICLLSIALMIHLHCDLFAVHCVASMIVVPMSTQSSRILSIHFFLGRPTGRVPWTLPCRRTYGYLSGPFMIYVQNTVTVVCCNTAVISFFISRSFFTSILRIRSCLVMPQILQSTAISNTQFPFMFLLYCPCFTVVQ